MEYIREIKISIYVDTNKSTQNVDLLIMEDESREEFIERITERLKEVLLNE